MSIISLKAPAALDGTILLPTSKSISNRLLMMSVLCGTDVLPEGLSDSDDTRVMADALQSDLTHVDVGAAGTSMRFLTAFLATRPGTHEITGSERMKKRPIALLVDALRQLGAKIDYMGEEGFPPLRIEGGHIHGGELTLPGGISSQYISALMMIAPTLTGGLTIRLEGKVVSVPYINMTREIMRQFGADVKWDNEADDNGAGNNGTDNNAGGNVIRIKEKPYIFERQTVEGDWSASSYWYAMTALRPGSQIRLTGLHPDSLQGDSAVAQIAAPLGVTTTFEEGGVLLTSNGQKPETYEYSFVNQPDLAQTFVVLCCLMGVRFRFTGLESLRIKETDRMAALENELRKIGYVIGSNNADTLWWDGTRCPATCSPEADAIATYKDHRMAMAFAPASLVMEGVTIAEPEVVSKSYPQFWADLRQAGFEITETN